MHPHGHHLQVGRTGSTLHPSNIPLLTLMFNHLHTSDSPKLCCHDPLMKAFGQKQSCGCQIPLEETQVLPEACLMQVHMLVETSSAR